MVSIITSIYNSEKYLKRYFQQVISFSKKANFEFEIIIVANDINLKESTIVNKNKESIRNIKILEVPREPLYSSWNRGIRESKYNLITFWNVDDIRFPEAIKDGYENIIKDYDITYFPFKYKRYISILNIDFLVKTKTFDSIKFSKEKFLKEMHLGPFFMFTKKATEKNGFFDENFKISGDFEWQVRATKNNLKFIKTDTIAGVFTNNGKTISGKKDKTQKKENNKIYDKYK